MPENIRTTTITALSKVPSDAEPLNSIITCNLPLGSRST